MIYIFPAPTCREIVFRDIYVDPKTKCQSKVRIKYRRCEGSCGKDCCVPKRIKTRKVRLFCEAGNSYVYDLPVIRRCACKNCHKWHIIGVKFIYKGVEKALTWVLLNTNWLYNCVFSACLKLGMMFCLAEMMTFTTVSEQYLKRYTAWLRNNSETNHVGLLSQTNPALSPTEFDRSDEDDTDDSWGRSLCQLFQN